MMQRDCEYRTAYAACRIYCKTNQVDSVQDLEEEVWPLLQGRIYVPLDVFRLAALAVLFDLDESKRSQVLTNEEAAALLASARSVSSS
jgi:hypothetical protein